MEIVIIIMLLACLLAVWLIAVRRRLTEMNENVNHAMGQMGVQLTSIFETLTSLPKLTESHAPIESQVMFDMIGNRQHNVDARSLPEEVTEQENIISQVLGCFAAISDKQTELQEDAGCIQCLEAVDSYRKMLYTGSLIYNDSVTKLNRAIGKFPNELLAGILGFHKRDYIYFDENE